MAQDTKNYSPIQMAQGVGIQVGAGAPTHSANVGTLYVNTSGSGTDDRMYINTDGSTTWTNFTTAA